MEILQYYSFIQDKGFDSLLFLDAKQLAQDKMELLQ